MISTGAGASQQQYQHQQHHTSYDQQYQDQQYRQDGGNGVNYDMDEQHSSSSGGYDRRSSEEYENSFMQVGSHQYSREAAQARVNGLMGGGEGGGGGGQPASYKVASTHDYLGYPKDQQPFGTGQDGLWDDEKEQELW
jgi:hypothetical protein